MILQCKQCYKSDWHDDYLLKYLLAAYIVPGMGVSFRGSAREGSKLLVIFQC